MKPNVDPDDLPDEGGVEVPVGGGSVARLLLPLLIIGFVTFLLLV